jgi:bacteriorhodopsin
MLLRMSRTHLPSPEPLDVDAVSVVTAGTVAWAIAGLALLAFGRDYPDWLWTCAAGFGLGLAGIWYCRRRRNRLGRKAAARAD